MSPSTKQTENEINGNHSLRTSAMICATIQIVSTVAISLILFIFINNGRASMVIVLITINLLACAVAVAFLLLCISKRKYGRKYDLILHSYLLSMLAVGLASLFAVLYYPLLLLQNLNHWPTKTIIQAGAMTAIGGVMITTVADISNGVNKNGQKVIQEQTTDKQQYLLFRSSIS